MSVGFTPNRTLHRLRLMLDAITQSREIRGARGSDTQNVVDHMWSIRPYRTVFYTF